VTVGGKVPSNWQEFLRVDNNKRELFHFLADTDVNIAGKTVVMTHEDGIKSSGLQVTDLTSIEPCNHKEADTRIMLHCLHAATCGNQRLCIRTDVSGNSVHKVDTNWQRHLRCNGRLIT